GSPGPMRMGSPGPGMMRNGGPPGPAYGGNTYRPSPRGPPGQGRPPMSPGFPPDGNSLGRPLPRGLQSNTIVPNKGTMVEDDDDVDDNASDAFGLENAGRLSGRRSTNATMGGRRE